MSFSRLHTADAIEGIECTRIADEGKVTGDDSDEQILVVAYVVVAGNMSFQLWLATTLGSKETERNELAHLQVKSLTGVVIAKAVVSQPFVDVSAVFRSRLPEVAHRVAETTDLCLCASLTTGLHRGGLL